jgi:hypothetical protein
MSTSAHPMSAVRRRRMQSRTMLNALLLGTLVLLVGLAQTPAGQSVTRGIGLSSSAEPFTELYFDHPSRLAAVTEGNSQGASAHAASFVIRNEQRRAMSYYWTIQADGKPLLTGRHDLGPGQKVTIAPRLRDPCSAVAAAGTARVNVQVSLEHPAESISYWEPCDG